MKRVLLVVTAATALILSLLAAPAGATPQQAEAMAPSATAGWVSNAALVKNPALYTQLGIPKPGSAPSSNASNVPAVPATSGTTCVEEVCGKVYGTNLQITKVSTNAQGDGTDGCIQAHYVIVLGDDYAEGEVIRSATGSVVCGGDVPGVYYYNFTNQVPDKLPYTCPSESILGVFWDRIAGDPQFRIYKKS